MSGVPQIRARRMRAHAPWDTDTLGRLRRRVAATMDGVTGGNARVACAAALMSAAMRLDGGGAAASPHAARIGLFLRRLARDMTRTGR